MNLKIWIKVKFRKYFYKKIDGDSLKGYRNLLKLIYHKNAEYPIMDDSISVVRYFVSVPKLKMDLIINSLGAEIINSNKIWPLNYNTKIYEKAIEHIKAQRKKQIDEKELSIKGKKTYIINELYLKIK